MRLHLLIGITLTACNTKQSPQESSLLQNDEIRKMILEDTFNIDTNAGLEASVLDDLYKKTLTQMALKPLKPNYEYKNLSIENVEDVYLNVLKTIKKYTDSSAEKKVFLESVLKKLELENEKLQQNQEYPIELKLKIASVKSDIHFLQSKQQLSNK